MLATKPATKPIDVHDLFAQTFNAGDVDAIVALYEPGATLGVQPGQTVTGKAAIHEALAGFLALKG